MEYLVTMTTHVPDGTPDAAVQDMRAREAVHSLELAREGHLLRLWRPPLRSGEWRTLGLFEAADRAELASVLLSMPLRVWRTDGVTPLSAHQNDPGPRSHAVAPSDAPAGGGEFFATFTVTVPTGTPSTVVNATEVGEAAAARRLAGQGRLERLWVLPGEGRTLGLWRAANVREMEAVLDALPLRGWSEVETTQLGPHPSDPGSDPR